MWALHDKYIEIACISFGSDVWIGSLGGKHIDVVLDTM